MEVCVKEPAHSPFEAYGGDEKLETQHESPLLTSDQLKNGTQKRHKK